MSGRLGPVNRRAGSAPAFSLVEVTLALGLCAFVLVSLVSLLPVGLQSAAHAVETTRKAAVLQKVASELAQGRYAAVSSSTRSQWGFDFDGNPTTNENETYFVVVRRSVSPVSLPGASGSSSSLLRVNFEISNTRAPNSRPVYSTITISDLGY